MKKNIYNETMKTYRCSECGDILLVGKITKGTVIEVMCKKTIKKEREAHDASTKPTAYKKCKTMKTITGF